MPVDTLALLGAAGVVYLKAIVGITAIAGGFYVLRDLDVIRMRAFRYAVWLLAIGFVVGSSFYIRQELGWDAHAYWAAWRHGHAALYDHRPGTTNAYLYSPAFAEAIWPLTLLPWSGFLAVWMTISSLLYLWLLWPVSVRWRIPLLLLVSLEVVYGNVWSELAVVAALGLRRPALWTFPLLTKVTPAIGFVWFAVRREWRHLAQAITAAVLVVAIAALVHLTLWIDWVRFLYRAQGPNNGSAPLALRLPLALGLTVWAARRNRPEWIPMAMILASPLLGTNMFALLAAVPRLRSSRHQSAEEATVTSQPRLLGEIGEVASVTSRG